MSLCDYKEKVVAKIAENCKIRQMINFGLNISIFVCVQVCLCYDIACHWFDKQSIKANSRWAQWQIIAKLKNCKGKL